MIVFGASNSILFSMKKCKKSEISIKSDFGFYGFIAKTKDRLDHPLMGSCNTYITTYIWYHTFCAL